ncbi:site-specific integrase [Paracoccus sp. MBLB3053]|uniref:Site-specific integrase n=1 Tax=Paracoccus aurantius TaxID=3073814 RepID=A0ABU2HU55_9RHOB|nr:site-specific integrase [Paracoccus sp. MBLB3053]MDS9467824.1 site-specific integrase [Paracoccus sp. MBLB3053]
MSALAVKALGPGVHAVGGVPGLYIQKVGNGASWLLNVSIAGKRRSIGLGGYPELPLAKAREVAKAMRFRINHEGADPIQERKDARAAAKAAAPMTFAEAVEGYFATKPDTPHNQQWREALLKLKLPTVAKIQPNDVEAALLPIWTETHETAKRTLTHLKAVLNWATVKGERQGENPAAHVKLLLPEVKASNKNHAALPWQQAPAFMAALRREAGSGPRALEWLMLTACRTQEAAGARWDEIKDGVWTVPASRMKMGRPHRIPLPSACVEMLAALPRRGPFLFPGHSGGPISDSTQRAVILRIPGFTPTDGRQLTVHGLRSCFKDWADEQGYDHRLSELALAHAPGSKTERAYARSDMLDARRELMQAWSDYLGAR